MRTQFSKGTYIWGAMKICALVPEKGGSHESIVRQLRNSERYVIIINKSSGITFYEKYNSYPSMMDGRAKECTAIPEL